MERAITFVAQVNTAPPFEYEWELGDGFVGVRLAPTYTYPANTSSTITSNPARI